MKSEEEITKAHDLISGALALVGSEEKPGMHFVLDTLCWVLDHARGEQFQQNIDKLEAYLTRMGYTLVREETAH